MLIKNPAYLPGNLADTLLEDGEVLRGMVNQPRSATLLKKRLWRRCFPVNFAKFLRTPFLQNTSGRLLMTCNKNIYGEPKRHNLRLLTFYVSISLGSFQVLSSMKFEN